MIPIPDRGIVNRLGHELCPAHAFRNAAVLGVVEAGVCDLQSRDRRLHLWDHCGEPGRANGLGMAQPPRRGVNAVGVGQ